MRNEPARAVWPPTPGYFVMRLAKGAWQVPCKIEREGGDGVCQWRAVIDGAEGHWETDPVSAGVDRIWGYGVMIDEPKYRYLLELKDWCRQYDPDHPCLHPNRPIDRTTLKPLEVLK